MREKIRSFLRRPLFRYISGVGAVVSLSSSVRP